MKDLRDHRLSPDATTVTAPRPRRHGARAAALICAAMFLAGVLVGTRVMRDQEPNPSVTISPEPPSAFVRIHGKPR